MAPKPVNVLVGSDFTTVAELAALGVRRISVGGALARSAWAGAISAAREIATHGTFTGLAKAAPSAGDQRPVRRSAIIPRMAQPPSRTPRTVSVRRFASAADADRAELDYWRQIPAAERVLLVWQLSQEQWQLAGHPAQ